MNKTEYAEYEASVADFMAREGLEKLSSTPYGPSFCWRACECCGSRLGGDRYDANGYNRTTGEVQEYTICADCAYYAEYGKLDDMTMMEIEDK